MIASVRLAGSPLRILDQLVVLSVRAGDDAKNMRRYAVSAWFLCQRLLEVTVIILAD